MHYDFDEIFSALEDAGKIPSKFAVLHEIDLEQGDTAVNPGSTKWVIAGPGQIQYTCYPDGGMDVRILEGTHRAFAKKE